ALVSGDWQLGDEYVDAPLLVQNRRNGERHVIVDSAGKAARTSMRLSRTFGQFSLMQCQPKTGRTHQIRVHALHTGHPIVGDERYGMPETNAMAKKLGLKRLFLHAQSIAFPDDSGNELHFTAPLPDDLDRFLNRIRGGGRKRRI
ncbi:MAG: RluA family pseudouridine synthase, partial [Woeseiales bacterium]